MELDFYSIRRGIDMSLKDKWKDAGKGIGHAFKNFGKALGTTAQVAIGDADKVDEDGNSVMKNTWREVGKGFGEAGKDLGVAAAGTVEKVVDDTEKKASEEEKPSEEQSAEKEEQQ